MRATMPKNMPTVSLTDKSFQQWWDSYCVQQHYYNPPYVDQRHYSIYSVKAAAKTAWLAAIKYTKDKIEDDNWFHEINT